VVSGNLTLPDTTIKSVLTSDYKHLMTADKITAETCSVFLENKSEGMQGTVVKADFYY
jgi:hypothetical protein